MMKICICGGGSLGHVCAGVLAAQKDVEVSILSWHPGAWSSRITVTDAVGREYVANIHRVSSDPCEVVTEQDIILLCVPGFLIDRTLKSIKPYIGNAVVGSIVSSSGFFFIAHEVLGSESKLFGFQRVPYISRVAEYGKTALILGYKSSLVAVLENIDQESIFKENLQRLFNMPVRLLDSFYEVALSNSNPILHTGFILCFAGERMKCLNISRCFTRNGRMRHPVY